MNFDLWYWFSNFRNKEVIAHKSKHCLLYFLNKSIKGTNFILVVYFGFNYVYRWLSLLLGDFDAWSLLKVLRIRSVHVIDATVTSANLLRYGRYILRVMWTKFIINHVKFPQNATYQKLSKSVEFHWANLKIKRWAFLKHGVMSRWTIKPRMSVKGHFVQKWLSRHICTHIHSGPIALKWSVMMSPARTM